MHLARTWIGSKGVDVAHQRVVDRWAASRGAGRHRHVPTCGLDLAQVAIGEPQRVVGRSELGCELDGLRQLVSGSRRVTELRQGPAKPVDRGDERGVITSQRFVARPTVLYRAA